ncbi:MAG: hypothetical protein ACI4UE_07045, partial [Candidatus Scatovivens sp.]
TNLVLQYDGEYNAGKTGNYHDSSTTTWVDLTGNGNNGNIVNSNSWVWKQLNYLFNQTTNNVDTDKYFRQVSQRTAGTSEFLNKSLRLSGNDYVVCDFYNYNGTLTHEDSTYNNYISGKSDSAFVIPDGSEPYTIEISFYYNGDNKSAGLFGMGTYNNKNYERTNDNYCRYFSADYFYKNIGYVLKTVDFKTGYYPVVGDEWHYSNSNPLKFNNTGSGYAISLVDITEDMTKDNPVVKKIVKDTSTRSYYYTNVYGSKIDSTEATNILTDGKNEFMLYESNKLGLDNGKSNAIRISDSGNGIKSYYWGNDVVADDENGLSSGVHTASVEYDGTNTKIYLDGVLKAQEGKTPNTELREITIGATNMKTTVQYIDNLRNNSSIRAYIYCSEKWTCTSKTTNTERSSILQDVYAALYSSYEGKRNEINMTFQYQEFLNDEVYSVRIYDRALSSAEIKYNYITDYYRFGSGT